MLVKFMPKGRCGLDYCLGKSVRGVDPRAPEVLHGSPEQSAQVIKSLDFANPFTSVVLTYERTISNEEAARDMTAFEEMLLPGLKGGLEYDRVWIRHSEHPKNPVTRQPDPTKPMRTALHCIIPNVHLPTGKRLQPYFDRVDRKRVEAWQELTNEAHGYASAKDPERRRAVALNQNRLPQNVADLKATLTEAVIANIHAEQISTRDDLTAWLKSQGFGIERTTKKSISISHPTLKKNLRLEGELYEFGGIESAASARDTGEIPPSGVRQIESDKYRRDLAEGLERKRDELQKRFARRNEKRSRRLGGNDQERPSEVGAGSEAGRSTDSGDQAQIHHLGECDLAPGGLDDGRADSGFDLGERGQGDGISLEPFAADRGGEVGGFTSPGRDGAERGNGRQKDSLGDESSHRQARSAASRSEGTGQSHHEFGGTKWGDLRGGASERSDSVLGRKIDYSNQAEQLNHEQDTSEPHADGVGIIGIVAAFIASTRAAAERVRKVASDAQRTISTGFRLGAERFRILEAASLPSLRSAFRLGRSIVQMDTNFERISQGRRGFRGEITRNDRDLQQGSRSVQLDENPVLSVSIPGQSIARIGRMIGEANRGHKVVFRGIPPPSRGFSR